MGGILCWSYSKFLRSYVKFLKILHEKFKFGGGGWYSVLVIFEDSKFYMRIFKSWCYSVLVMFKVSKSSMRSFNSGGGRGLFFVGHIQSF